jgi:naphthoate synthase
MSDDLLVEERDGVLWLTINRPDAGNMLRRQTCVDLVAALQHLRTSRDLGVAVLTGTGDRFFCIGGEKEETEQLDYSAVLPIQDVYEMIDVVAKPVIASVNGLAVGGGNVLQVMCDLALASERAVFRQVGPMVGSYDAGFGTWYLEDMIGRRRAKEMWYLNRKYDAEQALQMGLINEVVPHDQLHERTTEVAAELLTRGPQALAALKTAFSARHRGVSGQSRLAHDLLLQRYLHSEESGELSRSFKDRRPPDPTKFNR